MSKKISPVTTLSLTEALLWIVGMTLIITMLGHKGIHAYFVYKRHDKITYLVQTGPCREQLHSDYFMELLDLSIDKPPLFSSFNIHKAREHLLQHAPILQDVHIQKHAPDTVYIDYTVRTPLFCLGDFHNVAIDRCGVPFPLYPFFSPKRLPEIFFGETTIEQMTLGKALQGKTWEMAVELLDYMTKAGKDQFVLRRIDLSRVDAAMLGKREIIIVIENPQLHYLRCSVRHAMAEIDRYLQLRDFLLSTDHQTLTVLDKEVSYRVIDLRLEQFAFIR